MKKIKTNLSSYIQNMKGNLLGIGIDDDLEEIIDQNQDISICDLLDDFNKEDEYGEGPKKKKILIDKLRRVFKKNRFHYIVAPISMLKKYLKTFVRDSIYINQHTIYLYADKDYDYTRLQKMYHRYRATFQVIACRDGNIFEIDVKRAQDHPIKNKFYYMFDSFIETIDVIGDFLIK